MTRHTLITHLLTFAIGTGCFAQANVDVGRLIRLYNDRQFTQVFNEAYTIRKNRQYGKAPVVDYFLAKSLCAMSDFRNAQRMYDYILTEYHLQKSQKKFFLGEKESCARTEIQNEIDRKVGEISFNVMNPANIPSTQVSGKEGYVIDCHPDTNAYKVNPGFDPDLLERRLFTVEQQDQAQEFYKQLFKQKYAVSGSGRYIFITSKTSGNSPETARRLRDKLNRTYDFFWKFYGIRAPDQLLCVYLMPGKEQLHNVALQAHGLTLPVSNIGYSSQADLSILGIASEYHLGTMVHELFHLMVRTDVGDIPGWLDEGIASLYETSYWPNDTVLTGEIYNWRSSILKEFSSRDRGYSTDLQRIIRLNWDAFEHSTETDPCDITWNYALVKHLALWFQESGKLNAVVQAFRNRKNACVDTSYVNQTGLELLETATGMPADTFQLVFDRWLYDVYAIKTPATATFYSHPFDRITGYKNRLANAALGLNRLKGQKALPAADEATRTRLSGQCMKFQMQLSQLLEAPAAPPGTDLPIPDPLKRDVDDMLSKARQLLYKHNIYGDY